MRGINRPRKELRCLVVILVAFVLAWVTLMSIMPEPKQINDVQTRDYDGDDGELNEPQNPGKDVVENTDKPSDDDDNNNELPSLNAGIEGVGRDVSLPVPDKDVLASESVISSPLSSEIPISEGTPPTLQDQPSNDIVQERRDKVKEMIKLAWNGYRKFAFGQNELKPISKIGHSASIFGKTKLGATLVDSLDTLYIAGLEEEFNEAKKWVEEEFHLDDTNTEISVFEFNIRFVGGFLSAYALSGDEIFLEKAKNVAEKLLPAFNTPTGIPRSLLNLKSGKLKNFGWANGGSILSEVGTLHLEFQYLTETTKNPTYLEKAQNIRAILKKNVRANGLYSIYINTNTGQFIQDVSSLGALGDSFYEYLLKSWLITSKEDKEARDMYYNAIDALDKMLIKKPNGAMLVTNIKNSKSDMAMQHLACFSGGMYALGSVHAENNKAAQYMSIAKNITYACRRSYDDTATKLGPEKFMIKDNGEYYSVGNNRHYFLRPETVESYFYMWRLTHDQKYREWGWDMVQALEKHCRTDNGYSGIKDVYKDPAVKDDVQQSFFIAETLKYLYLLFSDDSVISLDKWVFNTEAHPLPVLPGIPTVATSTSNDS